LKHIRPKNFGKYQIKAEPLEHCNAGYDAAKHKHSLGKRAPIHSAQAVTSYTRTLFHYVSSCSSENHQEYKEENQIKDKQNSTAERAQPCDYPIKVNRHRAGAKRYERKREQ